MCFSERMKARLKVVEKINIGVALMDSYIEYIDNNEFTERESVMLEIYTRHLMEKLSGSNI